MAATPHRRVRTSPPPATRPPGQRLRWVPIRRGKKLGSDARAAYVFLAPALIGFTVFVVYPLIRSAYFALTQYNGLSDPKFVGFDNFRRMFSTDPSFWPSVRATLLLVVLYVPLSLAIGLALAVFCNHWTTADGKIGGVPSLMNTYGIWYDIDAFKAAGILVPAAGWTWDQMYDAAAKLHEKGAKYGLVADAMTALDAPFSLSLYSQSAGGAPFTDDVHHPTKVTVDAKYTEGVGKLVAGIKSGAVAPPGYDISNQ
ncbi:extracellular solute-binding protein [Streptomyces sp. NPDC002088]|uniref:extracellular solute-binding protein n=1 Tax=Streptomyces sp. NPDC002088 TaxID=3154665 RepID=UPI00333298A6